MDNGFAPRDAWPALMARAQAGAVDALRKRGRHWQRETPEEDAQESPGEDLPEHTDKEERLARILDQLPLRQRQIVEHVHLQEMSLAEAATQNNLSIAAVKSLLHRALTNLRRMGAKHGRS